MRPLPRTRPTTPARCDLARRRISEELDLELGRAASVSLRLHLAGCPSCRLFRRELRRLTLALREAELETPQRGPRRFGRAYATSFRAGAAAATLATVAAAAVFAVALPRAPHRPVEALPATQGMPVYVGLSPEEGMPVTVGLIPHGVSEDPRDGGRRMSSTGERSDGVGRGQDDRAEQERELAARFQLAEAEHVLAAEAVLLSGLFQKLDLPFDTLTFVAVRILEASMDTDPLDTLSWLLDDGAIDRSVALAEAQLASHDDD